MLLGFDVESKLIAAGNQAPHLICGSVDDQTHNSYVVLGPEYVQRILKYMLNPQVRLVAHNVAFDLTVCMDAATVYHGKEYGLYFAQAMYSALAAGRISCTLLRQKILDNALGMLARSGTKSKLPSESKLKHDKKSGYYSLAGCMWRAFGVDRGEDKAAGSVRYRYYEVEGVPVHQWPHGFETYSLQDSTDTRRIYKQQADREHLGCFGIEAHRVRASVTLRLAEIWGMRTNATEVEKLDAYCVSAVEVIDKQLVDCGLKREEWKKGDLKYVLTEHIAREWVQKAYENKDQEVPHSKPSKSFPVTADNPRGGQVKLDSDTLEAIPGMYEGETHPYEVLVTLAQSSLARGIHSKYIKGLRKGTITPLHPYYNVMLETGRLSCSDQVQTPPRSSLHCFGCGHAAKDMYDGCSSCPTCGGFIGDVRRCYEARKGYSFAGCDYPQVELITLGQTQIDLIGSSTIADAINRGLDLHCLFGGDLMGNTIPYEEFNKLKKTDKKIGSWRQRAKGGNFGLPGKLGAKGLQKYLRGFGVYISMSACKRLKKLWERRWDDMPRYFKAIQAMGFGRFGSTTTITHPRTGLVRGNVALPAACNMMFQTPAAFGCLDAGFHMSREMYSDPHSDLFGSRLQFMLHDEWISEVPEYNQDAAARRKGTIMQEVMQRWTPDVKVKKCPPVLMKKWYKAADQAFDANKKLIPWVPR